MKKQPQYIFESIDELPDEAVEEADPFAIMWAKIVTVAETLDVSEEVAQQIVLGRIKASAL